MEKKIVFIQNYAEVPASSINDNDVLWILNREENEIKIVSFECKKNENTTKSVIEKRVFLPEEIKVKSAACCDET